ncbi:MULTISPECIES: response regulator [Sphingobacterium]|uniref:Response regulator transcription factor n=1 Tax=Sphingobacterium litopenaei TaxID=2763500 RepID=A0ABR7YDU3_9SPHI|nr:MULTISPECIES: response regulator [Sphingobacterium]MBD1429456.1 response regulator transcription factor [Sphingobacterium litopenaei]NGM73301.1 response regulator transcription factor [Sphingobacterium sp. SGL-16]
MFKKVLIAEDHEVANISVQRTLNDLGVQEAKYVYYCDDALAWVSKALQNKEPYDLLITDLSFEEDHNVQRITSGVELIKAVKVIHPDIQIIVFSGENRPAIVNKLFHQYGIDAYVRKARHDAQHLKEALQAISNGQSYMSYDIKQSLKEQNSYEFSHVDIHIIKLLSEGIKQKEIPNYLKQKNIKPSGLSSIEKRLSTMREVLSFTKNEQLVAYCKDKGII